MRFLGLISTLLTLVFLRTTFAVPVADHRHFHVSASSINVNNLLMRTILSRVSLALNIFAHRAQASVQSAFESSKALSQRLLSASVRQGRLYANYGDSFQVYFHQGVDKERFSFANGFANGKPFKNGWSKQNQYVFNEVLYLQLKRDSFQDSGSATGHGHTYPFTSGEIRSVRYYGEGCFSTCMKPSGVSGVSSSFYTHAGAHDTPVGFTDSNPKHGEIDVEFVGKNTTRVQTNFFNRYKDPWANSGSGVEQWHDLGFDAAQAFHQYGFRWTRDEIVWTVDGREIRRVKKEEAFIPNPDYCPQRIVANVWPVASETEGWAGTLDGAFYATSSQYRWIRYKSGRDCQIRTHC